LSSKKQKCLKQPKVDTKEVTLALFKEGKNLNEIAARTKSYAKYDRGPLGTTLWPTRNKASDIITGRET
jgi:hypothetical protein